MFCFQADFPALSCSGVGTCSGQSSYGDADLTSISGEAVSCFDLGPVGILNGGPMLLALCQAAVRLESSECQREETRLYRRNLRMSCVVFFACFSL